MPIERERQASRVGHENNLEISSFVTHADKL